MNCYEHSYRFYNQNIFWKHVGISLYTARKIRGNSAMQDGRQDTASPLYHLQRIPVTYTGNRAIRRQINFHPHFLKHIV